MSRDREEEGVQSIREKISIREMGTRSKLPFDRESFIKENKKMLEEEYEERAEDKEERNKRRPENILNKLEEELRYRAKTKENRQIYEELLDTVVRVVGDVSGEVLKSLVDEVIVCIKHDLDIQGLFQEIDSDQLADIKTLVGQITDYVEQVVQGQEEDIGEEIRVGVNFESEQEDNDYRYYVQDIQQEQQVEQFHLQQQLHRVGLEEQEQEVVRLLQNSQQVENQLMQLFQYQHPQLVQAIIQYRSTILQQYTNQHQHSMQEEHLNLNNHQQNSNQQNNIEQNDNQQNNIEQNDNKQNNLQQNDNKQNNLQQNDNKQNNKAYDKYSDISKVERKELDLEELQMEVEQQQQVKEDKCKLPKGSYKIVKKGYEEIHVPAQTGGWDSQTKKVVKVVEMEPWEQGVFNNTKQLNLIQSRVFDCARHQDYNMLVCAPTGAGKTFIALLAMLNIIAKYRDHTGYIDLQGFKVIYIAPMKALVAEMVGSFTQHLKGLGVEVRELTGDVNISREEMEKTQVIVCTPEKYDIVTRKTGDQVVIKNVKLVVIDEIHLLGDQRGPVLESIVARTLRQQELTQEYIRIVGLSATLPNYKDVAMFCRVHLQKGLFYFDNTFRPVPLQQQYIGITEKKAIKKLMIMNNILYEKVIERAGKSQTIIFTHSRKDTIKTAKFIKEMAYQRDELGLFVKKDSGSESVLESEVEGLENKELGELVRVGIGVHHAGMSRVDRTTMEDLFSDKHLGVLVSTATLAWGVNLPAHTVIIKGTQVYSAEQGRWVELTSQDVLQMVGRAGRPNLDTKGEGIIITGYQELKYYLSLLNHQLSIESQFISQLVDQLNAEVQAGSVLSVEEGVQWLGYTYLYIRMLRAPILYNIPQLDYQQDRLLVQRRTHLVHSALLQLQTLGLAKYDKQTGNVQGTQLGKIASYYYLKHQSVSIYNQHLKQNSSLIELLRVFGLSSEFKLIPIREEEKVELVKLMDSVPVPVKTSPSDPCSKVNVLLQAYVSRLNLQGQAINCDMVFIKQSAARILRALFQLALSKHWAQLALTALSLAKMVENQMWACMTPLRQFKNIPEEILRRLEKKEQFSWEHFYQMSPQQLGDLVKFPKLGKVLHRYINQLPRLELQAFVQPVTRQTLKIDLALKLDFLWDTTIHGQAQFFWLFIEDCDSETLLHSQFFQINRKEEEKIFEIYVSLFEPLQPVYFIRVVSENWIGSESVLPVSFKNLILPSKLQVSTEVVEQKYKQVEQLENNMVRVVLDALHIQQMNQIQTQLWKLYYQTTHSIFLGASFGNQPSLLQLFALMQLFSHHSTTKAIYISQRPAQIAKRLQMFSVLGNQQLNKVLGKYMKLKVARLTGNLQVDIKLMEEHEIILGGAEEVDQVSRRWRNRKSIQQCGVLIVEDLHLLNQQQCTLEVVCSRFRYISSQLERPIRVLGFSYSIANYKDVAEWLGVSHQHMFNFSPKINPRQLDITFQTFHQANRSNRLAIMHKHVQIEIKKTRGTVIVVASDRKESRLLGLELCNYLEDRGQVGTEVMGEIKDQNVRHCLQQGIGLLYEGLEEGDQKVQVREWREGRLEVMVVSRQVVEVVQQQGIKATLVVIMDLEGYCQEEQRLRDYQLEEVVEMVHLSSGKVVVQLQASQQWFYKKHLGDSLPVESQLNHYLGEHLNSEVVAKTVENKQDCIDWITWTYFYRRLNQNPNYYNLYEVSGQHLNDYLSELVETAVGQLETQGCVLVEDEVDIIPLNPGIIASYYYIKCSCLHAFQQNLSASCSLVQLLQVAAQSFGDQLVIRPNELVVLELVNKSVRHPVDIVQQASTGASAMKANLLIQSHLDRLPLNTDLQFDQTIILKKGVSHLHAMIDVISSQCYLKQAILAIQLCQMLVQAVWTDHSQLLQLPHLQHHHLLQLQQHQVTDIPDFISMEDSLRQQVLGDLTSEQVSEMAQVCNRFPQLELSVEVESRDQRVGDEVEVHIQLSRQVDEEDYTDYVTSHFYPLHKTEHWYVIIGSNATNHLLAIKKVSFHMNTSFTLTFTPEPSTLTTQTFNIYLICDSYVGADQSHKFNVHIAQE